MWRFLFHAGRGIAMLAIFSIVLIAELYMRIIENPFVLGARRPYSDVLIVPATAATVIIILWQFVVYFGGFVVDVVVVALSVFPPLSYSIVLTATAPVSVVTSALQAIHVLTYAAATTVISLVTLVTAAFIAVVVNIKLAAMLIISGFTVSIVREQLERGHV